MTAPDLGTSVQVKDLFTSAFVVRTPAGHAIVFDLGFNGRGRKITAALAREGLDPRSVSHVFVTHAHRDHVAGAQAFPDAEVLALGIEAPAIERATDGRLEVTRALADGDVIEIDGLAVEVFAVPGHTAGSSAYLVDGVLILGDAAMLYRTGTVGPVAERYSDDPVQAERSLTELRERLRPRQEQLRAVLFAHSAGLSPVDAFF